VTAFTFPNIKRSTPITVTAYTPILYVFKPSTETSFTDCLRNPINCIVIFNKVVLNVCHLDKPGITRIVDKRCITSPTERIAVFKLRCIEQLTSFFKIYKNFFINIFTECTCPRCFLSHFTLTVNKLYERQVVLSADIRVVLTECRSDMNDTCTVCKSYITVASYIISLFIRCYEIEQRLIFLVFKVSTDILFNHFIFCIREVCLNKCLCQNKLLVTYFNFYICFNRVYTKCNV